MDVWENNSMFKQKEHVVNALFHLYDNYFIKSQIITYLMY